MQKKKNPIYIIVFLLIIIFIISLFVLAYSIKYPRRPYNPTVTNESEYGENIDDEIEEDDDGEKIEDETDEEFKKLYPIYTGY